MALVDLAEKDADDDFLRELGQYTLQRLMEGRRLGQGDRNERCLQEPGVAAVQRQSPPFLERPLRGQWPYLWLDATYLKSRQDGHVVNRAMVIAVGVNSEGRREVLRTACGPAETEAFWLDFLRSLAGRGLPEVRLVVSAAHDGLKAAAAKVLQVTWRRCRGHLMRYAFGHVPRRQHQMVAAVIRTGFVQENQQDEQRQWRETVDKLRQRFPRPSELMDDAEEDVLACSWPSPTSTGTRSLAPTRSRAVGIFPNDDSIIRLVDALLVEQNEDRRITRQLHEPRS